jgi:uncharacterized membrane protein
MNPAHAHLLLNHFPIIGTIIGLALLSYAFWRRSDEVGKVALGLFVALALLTVATFLTGEPAEEVVEGLAGTSESSLERHEDLARIATISMGVFGTLALGALLAFRRRVLPRAVVGTSLVLAASVAVLMALTANLGGYIRHSELRATSAPDAGSVEDAEHD